MEVESVTERGYVHLLSLMLQAKHPEVEVKLMNYAVGGYTSRDILQRMRDLGGFSSDLTFIGCGTNDLWRSFQGRAEEAVGELEFAENISSMVEIARTRSQAIYLVSPPPMNASIHSSMNLSLHRYNEALQEVATREGCHYLDLFTPLITAYRRLSKRNATETLWIDEAHLSPLGDMVVAQHILPAIDLQVARTRKSNNLI